VVGAQGGLGALGYFAEFMHPLITGSVGLWVTEALIDGRAHHGGHLGHVSRTALTAFHFYRANADLPEFWQDGKGIEAGRFLQGIKCMLTDLEAAFAQGRVARFFEAGEQAP